MTKATQPVCPLSKSNNATLIERIPLAALDALYMRLYGAPIARLYPGRSTIDMWQCNESDLIWFDPLVPGDEAFYNALQARDWYYVDHKHEFDVAARFISKHDKVLEVGSGKGNFGKFLNNDSYVGLDFSIKAKEMAAQNGIDVRNETVQAHADLNPGVYDVSCAFQVLEHVPDVFEFLEAMVKALKPGGKLIIAVPSEASYISRSNNLALNLPPHHMSRYTDQALKNICNYLPVDLLALEHDPLQPQHYFDYPYQIAMEAFRKRFGSSYKSVDNSFLNKVLRIPATIIGKLLQNGFNGGNTPIGHTVLAVYVKR
ncbi:MAG: class I SAM-dependent methyltransferase [Sphingobacteriaceae bacterium]|nr:class I SAM-dependent methyltransferase [Sphingobacteriaceae bacterium]